MSLPIRKLDYSAAVAVSSRELLERITFASVPYSNTDSPYLSQINFRTARSITPVLRKTAVSTALEFRSFLQLSNGCVFRVRKLKKDIKVHRQQDQFCDTAFCI